MDLLLPPLHMTVADDIFGYTYSKTYRSIGIGGIYENRIGMPVIRLTTFLIPSARRDYAI